ncbi:MAG: hypothetical protein ACPGGA_06180 [Balneolaceae bacterium]
MRTLLLSLFFFSSLVAQTNAVVEIEAFWIEAERQVTEGDYEAYAASFHRECILVNGISGNSIPIQVALDGWKEGFDNTKAGNMSASVEFRFSESALGESTAHQTGIFLYKWQNEGEEPQEVYIHFEALLTKLSGEWLMLMEYQKAIATIKEWDALL